MTSLKEIFMQRKQLNSDISENGENLSMGERQLISIARSILKPTRIVLVDEATANIDVKTESIIYKAMNEAFKNSTVITVAHRLNTVINSDRILVLEGGLLKEYDNPQVLLKNPNSFFASLYNESQKESKM
jgi:ABC-type multidrug transport system fused ATPase/permease subunit